MTLTDLAAIASIVSALVAIISLIVTILINSKVKEIITNYSISDRNHDNDANHHNQKVGGIGNKASYSTRTGDK